MLMSKSRLEKFLYALYSLDSSDLPKPLSRIEELYKCLVTGEEAPTFKPLSRVEKYLMAILGGYDVDSLPNPLSRVEVLLHKLATGDDNLDDFKSFLSEHEELLAEIIRNGGAGGNINIEYVLYTLSTEHNTLYNTAEKPVKSAILKGQTLVNLSPNKSVDYTTYAVFSYTQLFKFDTIYTIIYNVIANDNNAHIMVDNIKTEFYDTEMDSYYVDSSVGHHQMTFTYLGKHDSFNWWANQHDSRVIIDNIIILEGDYTNVDIPYFEGMQSVKMPVLTTTGKNLLNPTLVERTYPSVATGDNVLFNKNVSTTGAHTSINMFNCEYGKTYTVSVISGNADRRQVFELDENNNVLTRASGKSTYTVTNTNTRTLYWYLGQDSTNIIPLDGVQLEEGSTATSYEPYKTNILTVNEPVELRGIGDIQDTLDLMTGEVTQRIGEVVLDGSERWYKEITNHLSGDTDTTTCYYTYISDITNQNYPKLLSDEFPVYDVLLYQKAYDYEGIAKPLNDERTFIRINQSRLETQNVDGFQQWLSQNPITIQYQLKTESIKTVDLSVVDQDGNNTELKTFDDITHVTLSSEGLIPEAELEVATKNEEDLEDSSVYTTHTLSEEFNTLYNTAEKPVKSVILKGNTLVNISENLQTITRSVSDWYAEEKLMDNIEKIKRNTYYTVLYRLEHLNGNHEHYDWNEIGIGINGFSKGLPNTISILDKNGGWCKIRFQLTDDFIEQNPNFKRLHIRPIRRGVAPVEGESVYYTIRGFVILEGDYITNPIPFNEVFGGMQSVKVPVLTTVGKNLFNKDSAKTHEGLTWEYGVEFNSKNSVISDFIYNSGNTYSTNYNTRVFCYNSNKEYIGALITKGTIAPTNGGPFKSFEIPNNVTYFRLWFMPTDNTDVILVEKLDEIQLEGGSVVTSYEPYKSNILTTSEEVELRGIGDVKDTLDLMTGELTQNIYQITLTGDESGYGYNTAPSVDTDFHGTLNIGGANLPLNKKYVAPISNRFQGALYGANKTWQCCIGGSYTLHFFIPKTELETSDINGFKNWVKQQYLNGNPIKVAYVLEEKSIKTVDLSVVDQNGNDTKLSTFNDITHVTLSSEGLIPEAELEVAEKVPEVAASMLTISREQEVINATANEQSENVDATMIATTEIYEELL